MPKILFKSQAERSQYFINELKTIQKGKSMALMVDRFGLDYGFTKKPITEGLKTEFSLMTDTGGGASGGLSYINGTFGNGDIEQSVKGSYDFKNSRMILEWQRLPEQFHKVPNGAYSSPKDLQFKTKVRHHKNLMNIMNCTDGTGRLCSPSAIEGGSSGATIVKPYQSLVNLIPLEFSIVSGTAGRFGSITHLYENLVISFIGCSYDENNDGAAELTDADFVPRFLMIGFREEGSGNPYVFWDAFRIQDIDVYSRTVKVIPARRSALSETGIREYSKTTDGNSNEWCPHSGSANGLEIAPAWGISTDRSASDHAAHSGVMAAGWESFFSPSAAYSDLTLTGKPYLFHPGFVVDDYEKMRQAMGVNWELTTDLGLINPYWSTGIRALLGNRLNTVHGIRRPVVLPYLPTYLDASGQEFSFTLFKQLLNRHALRNRTNAEAKGKKAAYTKRGAKPGSESIIPVNTLVYSGLVDLVQANKMFQSEEDIVFGEGQVGIVIRYGGHKYTLVDSPEIPENFLPMIPNRLLYSMGGEIKDVVVGGNKEFLKLNPDTVERMNVSQQYKVVTHENYCEHPRLASIAENFTVPASF